MRIQSVLKTHNLIVMLVIVSFLGGCSGYCLVLDETTVLELDTTHLTYKVTVKNEPPNSPFCTGKRFYGKTLVQAYLTDMPQLGQSNIRMGAGGAQQFGHEVPNDPNNVYGFRVLDVGETACFQFDNVRFQDGIDTNVTPYLILVLESSTEASYGEGFKTGTGRCNRYGETHVIDLRVVNSP